MTKQYLKPIALAVSIALALTACGKPDATTNVPSASSSTPAAPSSIVPATAGTTAAVANGKSIFDISELGAPDEACQDFNQFVNAKWVAANPIPSDRTRWGAFDQLAEDSLNTQHTIVENAAKGADQATAGSIEQKIGNLYKSGMDEAAIDKAGFDPIKPKLAEIDGLKNSQDIANYLDKSFADGDMQVFAFGSGADFKHAETQIGYTFQSGLGLPTKDYYTDPKHADLRKAYLDYIAKTLELAGVPAAAAKQQADQVMAFETRLAAASLAPVELRTPENQYHFVSVKDADKVTPHFSWENFFKAQGVTVDKGFSLSQPKFFAEFDQLLAKAPVSQWQAYLRFHVIDDASTALSKNFRDNKFDFYGKTLAGQPEQKPRWKQVL
ncbi:MAG: peptidase, partial [Chloroflexota bacterium]